MFSRFSGQVEDHGSYLVVRTPENPTYHWGNFLFFREAPVEGDCDAWCELFAREFGQPEHLLFAWDRVEAGCGHTAEFEALGLKPEPSVVLTTEALGPAPHENPEIQVQRLKCDEDWQAMLDLEVTTRPAAHAEAAFRTFKERQLASYKRMSEAGMGDWYAARIAGEVVGGLGLFHEGGIARYQNVVTHPGFRRRGICGTLVQRAAQLLRDQVPIDSLVMLADPDYHAARIYESLGFKKTELLYSLYRHDSSAATT